MKFLINAVAILIFAILLLREGCNCAVDIFNKFNSPQEASSSTTLISNSPQYESASIVNVHTEAFPIESYIDGEFTGFDSDKIFKLTNGQVWQQDEYKYNYSYKYRPKVTIVKSSIYYKILVEGMSDAVKVKLISGNINNNKRSTSSTTSNSVIEAYVTNDFKGFNSGNIYKLDNGQVWEQTEPYIYIYIYIRPKVMIYSSNGVYKLKFGNIDHAVTVKKIN